MGEILFMAVLAIIAIGMFVMTYDFPISIIDKSGGAALFPRIMIVLLLFFLVIRFIAIIKTKREGRPKFVFIEIFQGPRLVYLLTTLAFIIVLNFLGFILSAILYLLILVNYFYYIQNDKKPSLKTEIVVVVCVIAGIVGLEYFFGDVLNIMLPEGILQ
jgi:putative tricarboxylic transport membrane protein